VVLISAAAWLAAEASGPGLLAWERITALMLLTLPALTLLPAKLLGLQIGPALLWLAMAVLLRRPVAKRNLLGSGGLLPRVSWAQGL
jgi:hypothetical protein